MNRLTHLRWLTTALGKRGFMKTPAEYGLEAKEIERTYVATEDKSWSGKDFVPEELISKAKDLDPSVGIKFELMNSFGLRIQEAILIRPRVSDMGSNIIVEEGTKGGRPRQVLVVTEKQRDILDRAKKMLLMSTKGAMISLIELSPESFSSHLLYLRKAGHHKGQSGSHQPWSSSRVCK